MQQLQLEETRKIHLISGYIHKIQELFSDNKTYHHITDDVKSICTSYIYWYHERPSLYKGIEDDNHSNYFFLHPHIMNQQYILEERHQKQSLDELKQIMMDRFVYLKDIGFIDHRFVTKMKNEEEILKFLHCNRNTVKDSLNKRIPWRPSVAQLQQKNIIPYGAYIDGINDTTDSSEVHIRHHPFKITETILELENHFNSHQRPSLRLLLMKGILSTNDMVHYFNVDLHELNTTIRKELKYSEFVQNMLSNVKEVDANKADDELYVRCICTVCDALKQSCANTQYEEAEAMQQMMAMNNEMKGLRDDLDKYFLAENPDIDQFQTEEKRIRSSFHVIKENLMKISTKQKAIQNKLKILNEIEHNLPSVEQRFNDDWFQLSEYKRVLNRDLNHLLNLKQNVVNIDEAISELKRLKQNIEDKLCESRINGLQSIYSVHREIEIADTYSVELQSNIISFHGARFILLIWLGTDFPNDLLHIIAAFVASEKVSL